MLYYTAEENEWISRLYKDYTLDDLVEMMPSHSRGSIRAVARSRGILKGYKKYYHNHTFFSYPNAVNSYWAGFFAADAYISKSRNQISFDLHERDAQHLEILKDVLEFSGEVKKRIHKSNVRKTEYKQVSMVINNAQDLIEDLESNFNVSCNKSATHLPPNLGNTLLEEHFIIGMIDGDGCIYHDKRLKNNAYQIHMCGSREILTFSRDMLCSHYGLENNMSIRPSGDKLHVMAIYGVRAKTILYHLSHCTVPFLERKWNPIVGIRDTWKRDGEIEYVPILDVMEPI